MCAEMNGQCLDIGTDALSPAAQNARKCLEIRLKRCARRLETKLHISPWYMDRMKGVSRRFLLWSGAGLGAPLMASRQSKSENVHRFATAEWDVRMTVEFYDRYSSRGFWFDERRANRHYCLSAKGQEDRGCLANFSGSLAVVQYRIRPRFKLPRPPVLREHVRTIDQDARLNARAPFDRTMELQQGVASDIQAFGYEANPSVREPPPDNNDPWCLLRQDLYFQGWSSPFLIVHWKHALSAIRILDVIPGDRTWAMDKDIR